MEKKLKKRKQEIVNVLQKYGVVKAGLFGSQAKDKAGEKSDVDLLVEFEEGRSLLDLSALKIELEQLLRREVDILTYKSISPLLRKNILNEEVRIYER